MAITFGIIGTNWITDTWITAAHKSGKWQLHSVYSRTAGKAKEFAGKYNVSNTHTSLDSFAADSDLQVVYIASPNNLHYEQAKQMLQAGKHVVLEKPATSTVAELDDLFRTAAAHGVLLLEAYRHIQEANVKLLAKLLHEDKILGTIYGASFTYASYSSRYDDVLAGSTPNIFSLDFSGGSLVDVGVYPVTLAVTLFGAPKTQTYAPFICATGVDGGGPMILRYGTFGVQINQAKGYSSRAPCEIYGEKGTIVLDSTAGIASLAFWQPRSKEPKQFAGPKTENMMEEEAVEFARIVEQKDTAAVARLEQISRDVINVTTALRYENDILYPADKR